MDHLVMQIPPEVNAALAGESPDFVVKASRAKPLSNSCALLAFAMFWLTIVSGIGSMFFKAASTFQAGSSIRTPPPASSPSIALYAFLGVFVMIGLGMFFAALYSFFKPGSWFAGTAKRLVEVRKRAVVSHNWSQCTGNVTVNGAPEKGNVVLELQSGDYEGSGGGAGGFGSSGSGFRFGHRNYQYVADTIAMIGIQNPFEVEKICRKRIEENTPKSQSAAS